MGDTSARFRSPMVPRRTPRRRFCDISAPFRRPTVYLSTLGEHFCTYPSPNSALPHARGTLRPVSVTQGCRAARSGNISASIRRPMVYLSTPGEHFCTYPSPDGAAPHARATLTPVSVAGEGGARETDGEVGVWGTDGRRGWAGGRKRHGHGDGNGDGDGNGHKSSRR